MTDAFNKPSPMITSLMEPGMEPQCLTCRDARWVYHDVKMGHPEFGKPFPCRDCMNPEATRSRAAWAMSGIPEARYETNLATFKIVEGSEKTVDLAWALGTGKDKEGRAIKWFILSIFGIPGNGKTHIAYGIGKEFIARGLAVKFWTVQALLRALREEFNTKEDHVMAEIAASDLLILDDLAAEQGTDWQMGILEEIINERYQTDKALVITCNRDRMEIDPKTHEPWLSLPVRGRLEDKLKANLVVNLAPNYRNRIAGRG